MRESVRVQKREHAKARKRANARAMRERARALRPAGPAFVRLVGVLSGLPSLAAEPAGRPPPAGSFGRCAAGLEPTPRGDGRFESASVARGW